MEEKDPVRRVRRGPALDRVAAWCVVLCALLGVSLALRIPPYQVDDSYINYRYAVNLAAGKGFSYSVGQAPVEGFSSPVWLLGLAAAAAAGLDPAHLPACSVLAGLASFLFVLWVMTRPAARAGAPGAGPPRPISAYVSACLFALLPTAITYSVMGLETLLFAAVVVVFAMSQADELPSWAGLTAAVLAAWVRPEGAWLLVALAAQRVAMGGSLRLLARRALPAIVMVVLGGLALVACRLAIFGDLLPNTYYAKTPEIAAGVAYVARTFKVPALIGLVACAILGGWAGGPIRRGYLAAGIAWTAAAILEGGDWMGGGRLLLPALAMLTLAAGGVGVLLSGRRSWSLASLALVSATLAGQAALAWHLTGTAHRAYDTYRYEEQVLMDWIEKSRTRSIALMDIGELGFRSDIEITDLGGLTDRVIARSAGPHFGKQVDLAYLFDVRAPDVVLLRLSSMPAALESIAPTDAMSVIEGRILADPRLPSDYAPLFLQVPAVPRRPLNARVVYLRKGVEIPAAAGRFRGVISIHP
jgi:arabinofuranosyltransferase